MKIFIIDPDSNSYSVPANYELAGKGTNLADSLADVEQTKPDILLLNIKLLNQVANYALLYSVPYIIAIADEPDPELLRMAMAIKSRDLIIKPVKEDKLIEALSNAVRTIEKEKRMSFSEAGLVDKSTIVTVFSPKGGVGKSTLAINLAAILCSKTNKKVVI
ncbi:MAG: hypothetical protein ABIH39_05765, partial [Candidatus Margulisiibacteriota bacterium]